MSDNIATLERSSQPQGAQISRPKPWEKTVPLAKVAPFLYWPGWVLFQTAIFQCLHVREIRKPGSPPAGGYILSCTHLSHLEPFCASLRLRQRIHWVTRKEFFVGGLVSWLLRSLDAFSLNRQGRPIVALRTAIERARDGRVIGICPEGGVTKGLESMCRGGKIKRGVCLIAAAAQKPIVPCVMLGTDKLNCVPPWIPFRRASLWIAFGEPIMPSPLVKGPAAAAMRRAQRAELATKVEQATAKLYQELLREYQLEDSAFP